MEEQIIMLANTDAWEEFAAANREALCEEYGTLDKALRHVLDGGLTMGGGATPLFRVVFAD